MASNEPHFNNDVVSAGICFCAENVNLVNTSTPKMAQDFTNEDVLNELFAATGMQSVKFGHNLSRPTNNVYPRKWKELKSTRRHIGG